MVNELRIHLKRHRNMGQLTFPILCRQGGCKSSYSTIFNFIRHIESHHSNGDLTTVLCYGDSNSVQNFNVCDDNVEVIMPANESKPDVDEMFRSIQTDGISLVAELRANSSIPYCVIPGIVESLNNVAHSVASLAQAEVLNILSETGVDSDIKDQIVGKFKSRLHNYQNPLEFLSTVYRQDSFFQSHPLAATAEQVNFSPRVESHSGVSRLKYDTFEYVSVQKTLNSLLQNEQYVTALVQDKYKYGYFTSFADGMNFKAHMLFSDRSKFSLMLQLFYDGLGVTNALRSHGSVHNIGVFYYTVKNLSDEFNSCFGNVHLLALCYTHDLTVHGFEPILNKFVAEIKQLSSVGFDGIFPVLGKCTVYASLCQVTSDNLALNSLLGFIESFSGSFFCTICYATSDDIQKYFTEEMFTRRSVQQYNKDLEDLPMARSRGKNHSRGVKKECVLNKIDGFHVVDNWSLDIMHILLEGVIPVELGCILYGLCVVDKCVTLDKVNSEFLLLWGKITVDKKHKPAEISKLHEPGHGIVPSMKAVQYWALLKYMPLAIGRFIPPENQHWQFLLHLSHMIDLIFARRFTHEMVLYLRIVISEHLSTFVDLYASDEVKLRPKHHLLVHLPTIILKSGPLHGMSCLRYELKNSFFKRSAHIVCNFTNICHTLANRHQQHALFSHLSNSHIRTGVVVSKHTFVTVKNLSYCDILCDKLAVELTDNVAVTKTINAATIEYKIGHLVILNIDEYTGDPLFGHIVEFISTTGNHDSWHIVCESVKTKEFVYHLHAFAIEYVKPSVYSFHRLNDLADHHVLYCHKLYVGHTKQHFVRLPYHVL